MAEEAAMVAPGVAEEAEGAGRERRMERNPRSCSANQGGSNVIRTISGKIIIRKQCRGRDDKQTRHPIAAHSARDPCSLPIVGECTQETALARAAWRVYVTADIHEQVRGGGGGRTNNNVILATVQKMATREPNNNNNNNKQTR